MLGVKQLATTAYHPKTHGKVERYNRMIVAVLGYYVADNQRDWDMLVQSLINTYKTLLRKITGTTTFSLVQHSSATGTDIGQSTKRASEQRKCRDKSQVR